MTIPNPIAEKSDATTRADVEAQVRRDAANLSPTEIEAIVTLVLRFGPGLYKAILRLFHVTPQG